MKKVLMFCLLITATVFYACEPEAQQQDSEDTKENSDGSREPFVSGNSDPTDSDDIEWLIPRKDVYGGGVGKDGIPALESPELEDAGTSSYLKDEDLIIGIRIGDEARAYPHPILDWHEIINDQIGLDYFSILYCPLTGTGMAWNRRFHEGLTTFGVSGLLYNSNLIPYDRLTDSYWSQMRLDCVGGELAGEQVEIFPVIETSWKTWLEMYPNSKVVTTKTGHTRNYGVYPYGDYRTNNSYIIFPVTNTDWRLDNKERVHGILGDVETLIYRFEKFSSGINVYLDSIDSKPIIVAGSKDDNFIVSFYTEERDLNFSAVQNQFPIIFEDSRGNKYDVFGSVVSGIDLEMTLETTKSYIGYWFAWAAFNTNLEIR